MYIYIYICVCVNDYVIYKCDQTGPSSHNDFLSAGTPEFVSLNCHLIASVTVPCSVPPFLKKCTQFGWRNRV